MTGGGLARRYVQPLFEVAKEKDQLDAIFGDLEALDTTLKQSPELKVLLADPSRDRQAKKNVVEQIFSEASQYTLNFMRVVIDKNRNEIFDSAYKLFKEMLNHHRGVIPGEIETPEPLDEVDYLKVKEML